MKNGRYVWKEGAEEWWKDGRLHREYGPAIIENGCRDWLQYGLMHCEYGPATVWKNTRTEWWYYHYEIEIDDLIPTNFLLHLPTELCF
jgi:hypothetical protein